MRTLPAAHSVEGGSSELLRTLLEILGYEIPWRNEPSQEILKNALVQLLQFLRDSDSQSDPEKVLRAALSVIEQCHPQTPSRVASDPGRIVAEVMALFHAGLVSHLSLEIKTLLTQLLLLAGLPNGGSKKYPFQVLAAPGVPIVPGNGSLAVEFKAESSSWKIDTDLGLELKSWLIAPEPIVPEPITKKSDCDSAGPENNEDRKIASITSMSFRVQVPKDFEKGKFSVWIQAGGLFDRLRNSAWRLVVEKKNGNDEAQQQSTFVHYRITPVLLSGTERIYCFEFKSDQSNGMPAEVFGTDDDWKDSFEAAFKGIIISEAYRALLTSTFPTKADGANSTVKPEELKNVRLICNVVEAVPQSLPGQDFRFPKKGANTKWGDDRTIIPLGDFPASGEGNELSQLIFSEAPRFFRHQSRPVTVQDWQEIVQDCDDRIGLAVVREGYCRENQRFGKGVHVSFLPRDLSWTCGSGPNDTNSDIDGLHSAVLNLASRVRNALEQVRPMGVLFEIWPVRFITYEITVNKHCFDAADDVGRVLENLRGMCSIELMKGSLSHRPTKPFVQRACFAFKRRQEAEPALKEFCHDYFFSQDHLSVPYILNPSSGSGRKSDLNIDVDRGIKIERSDENAERSSANVWEFPLIRSIEKDERQQENKRET